MSQTRERPDTQPPFWQKALLIPLGVGFAYLVTAGTLALFPDLIPDMSGRAREESAAQTMYVEFRYTDGDLFAWLPGSIRPPEEDVVLEAYTISWDGDGFRVPQLQAHSYPIAVLGDSFTEGPNVPLPYPDLLAQELDVPVRNYGYRNYGPQDVKAVGEEFVAQEERAWLIYGYFGGNDLSDLNRPAEESIKRTPDYLLPWVVRTASGALFDAGVIEGEYYEQPWPVTVADKYYDIVFLEFYLWWQRAPETGFADSRSFELLEDTLAALDAAVSPETCRALVFIPTKEQLYYPFIHEDIRAILRERGKRPVLQENGLLDLEPAMITEEQEAEFISHLGDHRDAVEKLATEMGWHFIDLLEPFEEAVGRGELLYYRYDSHWNQDGHRLAAQVIADYVRSTPECQLP